MAEIRLNLVTSAKFQARIIPQYAKYDREFSCFVFSVGFDDFFVRIRNNTWPSMRLQSPDSNNPISSATSTRFIYPRK